MNWCVNLSKARITAWAFQSLITLSAWAIWCHASIPPPIFWSTCSEGRNFVMLFARLMPVICSVSCCKWVSSSKADLPKVPMLPMFERKRKYIYWWHFMASFLVQITKPCAIDWYKINVPLNHKNICSGCSGHEMASDNDAVIDFLFPKLAESERAEAIIDDNTLFREMMVHS